MRTPYVPIKHPVSGQIAHRQRLRDRASAAVGYEGAPVMTETVVPEANPLAPAPVADSPSSPSAAASGSTTTERKPSTDKSTKETSNARTSATSA